MAKRISRQVDRALTFAEQLSLAEERKARVEVLRLARAVALAGLPKKRSSKRTLTRTMRLGADFWLRVTHRAGEDNELPFGEDRFVLAGVQHLAIENNNPVVFFDRVGQLLSMFGLGQSGRDLARLRDRFKRLSGLSIHLAFAGSEEDLGDGLSGEQIFVIRKYALPSRHDLKAEQTGQTLLPAVPGDVELRDSPYGVVLSEDFWGYLKQTSNRLLVPLELLRLFIDRPTGWDYACFLVARCGSALSASTVPHEALMSLFKDSPDEPDRAVIWRLKRYHDEIDRATGGRLGAELLEDDPLPHSGRGRPSKRWMLKVSPGGSVLGKVLNVSSRRLPSGR